LQPKGGISPLTYRIDLGKTQETDFFQSISPGVHFATVTDAKGCESFPVTFVIFEYPVVPPPFFSPNDDGINDLWIPKGIEAYPDAKIRVFDRYGQVLFETTGANPAWDGRFNGQILPTTDYWYRILLEDEGQLIGHFTLLH
jgi:gliding motility-associated-like protein